jgi:hypothetical protein
MMCRGVVAVVLGVGVWAFAVWAVTSVADNTDTMIKIRLTELFDECMEPSCGVTSSGRKLEQMETARPRAVGRTLRQMQCVGTPA